MTGRSWKYRNISTTTLRAMARALGALEYVLDAVDDFTGRPVDRERLPTQLAEIRTELLARELPGLAEESGGVLLGWVEGWQ